MTTLYKRATPFQQQLIRIVEGQIKSYHHHHELPIDDLMVSSITKRIVGDLSAQWDKLNTLHYNCST